jgi:hypothetical protein
MGQDLILSGSFIGSAPTGPTGPVFTTNAHIIPNAENTLSLGSYTNPWKEMYVGPGSLNIAGPSGASATLGSDQNGIAYTAKGFATPFINIGPNINALDNPGAIGGWVLAPTGTLGGPDYDLVVQQKLPGAAVPAGLTGPVYSLIKNPTFTGPTGPQGQNGITGGLTLFFDTAGGDISGATPTPVSGTLLTIPIQTAQTTIAYSFPTGPSTGIQIGSFITPADQIVSPIVAGLWSVNLYARSNDATRESYYATISSVDADGTSDKTLIVSGSAVPATIPNAQGVYTQDLYVPTTALAAGKRIIIDLFVNNTSGSGRTVTLEFRSTSLSHVHTTIIGNVATGPTGPIGPTGNKTFIIDHPTDPTRYLVHACIEGPEVGVYYRGKGTIAPNTISTVITLPAYVSAFANNFTIQITPIYTPGQTQCYLSTSELVGNRFEVYGQPGAFYWHVHGSRRSLEVEPLKSAVTVRGDGPYKYLV